MVSKAHCDYNGESKNPRRYCKIKECDGDFRIVVNVFLHHFLTRYFLISIAQAMRIMSPFIIY